MVSFFYCGFRSPVGWCQGFLCLPYFVIFLRFIWLQIRIRRMTPAAGRQTIAAVQQLLYRCWHQYSSSSSGSDGAVAIYPDPFIPNPSIPNPFILSREPERSEGTRVEGESKQSRRKQRPCIALRACVMGPHAHSHHSLRVCCRRSPLRVTSSALFERDR